MVQEETLHQFRNKERLVETRNFLIIASSLLSLPLMLIFWLSDIINFPEQKWWLLGIRSLTIPVWMVTNYLTRRFVTTLTHAQWTATWLVLGNCVIIDVIIWMTGGGASAHYAGLNLVCAGGVTLVAWTSPFLVLNIALIYLPYLVIAVLTTHGQAAWAQFSLHLFFIGATLVISLVLRDFAEHLRIRELKSRLQLREELRTRAHIIEEKTNEAIRLRTLTKQFSPQVVHAIQSGRIDILGPSHPAQICAMFVDIVDSTRQVKRVGMDATQAVVSLFMEDTMKVLLKHDITIDKFLGDGVLAFSGDPIARDDYRERVVDAALEVRTRIASHAAEYARHWPEGLRIRVGIASGDANVGFYGSDEYFKSYTAIGDVMIRAARLCNSAEPDQILISHDVVERLPTGLYTVRSVGERVLKGLGTEGTPCFEVISSQKRVGVTSEINLCPKGHGVLHLDNGPMGTPIFVCRTCGYSFQAPREESELLQSAS